MWKKPPFVLIFVAVLCCTARSQQSHSTSAVSHYDICSLEIHKEAISHDEALDIIAFMAKSMCTDSDSLQEQRGFDDEYMDEIQDALHDHHFSSSPTEMEIPLSKENVDDFLDFYEQSLDDYRKKNARIVNKAPGPGPGPGPTPKPDVIPTDAGYSVFEALEAIYSYWDGQHWSRQSNWVNRSSCYCIWEGVECESGCDYTTCKMDQCRIKGLQLSSIGLRGSFSTISYFENITPALVDLDLSDNSLMGTLSNFDFPVLTSLKLSANKLMGTIPSFSRMPALEYLDLSNNQLIGSLPDLDQMPFLLHLDISSNSIMGTMSNFSSNPLLQYLSLGSNKLTGALPDSLQLTQLFELHISGNQLKGFMPDLRSMQMLATVFLDSNFLSGSVGSLNSPLLQYASLARNQFTSVDIERIGGLELGFLDISENMMEGEIPPIDRPRLVYFSAANNQYKGNLPILRTPSLEYLDLSNNQINGTISRIENPNMWWIDFSNNQIEGTLPDVSSPNLYYLSLSWNNFRGTISPIRAPNLGFLNIGYNLLEGSLPRLKLDSMVELNVQGNMINGTIPELNMPTLESLILSSNKLSGTFIL
eukprot:TRINITY_DN9618_c0_g1_i4.p2 TRINITY_DN9618_c0_g1~~TRINITY_DN9618_c0_g1_i4.p2  ORF type:complete len:589 (+),score=91.91 TRINITY_DN9618_c0_g1_i4:122-1888(+)